MFRLCTIIAVCAVVAFATTHRVPEDFDTIQAALDNTVTGDTVLVSPGFYHESLQAPAAAVNLRGIAAADDIPDRPVVDPSPLPGSTHLACLSLPFGSIVTIRNFGFYNGPAMYPREHVGDIAGIVGNGSHLSLDQCRFDSTYRGLIIGAGGRLWVERCQFLDNVSACLAAQMPSVHPVIRNTTFTGAAKLLTVADSARIEFCSFRSSHGGEWTWMEGPGLILRGCSFGPSDTVCHAMVWTINSSGCLIEDNSFQDLELWGAAILYNGIKGDTTCIRRNYFKQNTAIAGGTGMILQGPNLRVRNNIFDSCTVSLNAYFRSIQLEVVNTLLSGNKFYGPLSAGDPHVVVVPGSVGAMQYNYFFDTGYALYVDDDADTFSAESNWWGDESGPFHAELNPEGDGDMVTGPVDFVPWAIDSIDAVPEPPGLLPSLTVLEVSPNPFNMAATLSLTAPRPGVYHVRLYDLLGRHVRSMWYGHVSDVVRIHFDAATLPSGIYIAQAVRSDDPSAIANAKLVLLK